MRAVRCLELTSLAGLRLDDVDPPVLEAGSILIDVHAAGVNFADTLITRGEYQEKPPLPFSPGMEVAGIVREVAPYVARISPGDRILAQLDHGGFAEQVVTREEDVARIPDTMDFPTAATFPIVYLTSHLALQHRARLQRGEILLVHGASGGVGLAAVEVGKALGATVIASASSPEKLTIAQQHGADHLINYARDDIRDRVLALTGGADVVYDPVGGDSFRASLHCINPGGRILIIGFASGDVPQIPANHLLVKDASALGLSIGQIRKHQPKLIRESLTELLAWWSQGRLKPLVSATHPLEDYAQALDAITSRRSTGKLALIVRNEATA
jgi:NADPH2:quinone reductase